MSKGYGQAWGTHQYCEQGASWDTSSFYLIFTIYDLCFTIYNFFFAHVRLHVSGYVKVGALWRAAEGARSLGLELQAVVVNVMWLLGAELRTSGRAASAPNW